MSVVLKILKRAFELQTGPTDGRLHTDGTALFTALHEYNHHVATYIRDTDKDPYRNPENIDRFIAFLSHYYGT